MSDLPITRVRSIRECEKDEAWLRDRIYAEPQILGLGNLEVVARERTQPQGGRLDLLFKNPDDDSMFEVELQLGATDESHIIRTIEYWDSEKRRWPRRSHTAVLVAENINNRFFNVVRLLSHAVPIIGIQASIVQVGDVLGLHFTKILDTYEEPEENEAPQQAFDEAHWSRSYSGVLEVLRWFRALIEKRYGVTVVKYFEDYASLTVGPVARVWVHVRKNSRAFVEMRPTEAGRQEAVAFLDAQGLAYTMRGDTIRLNVSIQELRANTSLHEQLTAFLSPDLPTPV